MRTRVVLVLVVVVVSMAWIAHSRYAPNSGERLFLGIKLQQPEWVQQALARNASVRYRDECGMTALMWAVINGDEPLARNLLDRGAEIEVRCDNRMTPLGYAAAYGRAPIAQLLLDRGASVNATAFHGGTPLHMAAASECLATARLLIDRGADVNARNASGETSLIVAASRNGNAAGMIELFLNCGADPGLADNRGNTALSTALAEGATAVAEQLQRGAAACPVHVK